VVARSADVAGEGRSGHAAPADRQRRGLGGALTEWLDHHTRVLFITPAVVVILVFSIFPTIASAILALSRVKLKAGSYAITFVGFANFRKQLFGSEQIHFLGKLTAISPLGWAAVIAVAGLLLWWLVRYLRGPVRVVGLIGRLITTAMLLTLTLMFAATLLSGGQIGTLAVTLFYVGVGCIVQFLIGLGLALLCAQPIRGRTFFRLVFFLPLMITPIGIGYAFRMLADTTKGPFSPLWQWVGLGDFAWVSSPWAARSFIVIADSWQWIPFIFVVMLAALESVSRDQVEAGEVDGAGGWQIFREITWPQIAPVAATVMLIRVIEAFKLVDLPNIMTAGGPGTATESMTLAAFFAWRSPDLAQAAAISYLLLFVILVLCTSFFNFVVLSRREAPA
jgi:multiple sugar transport system permease protein